MTTSAVLLQQGKDLVSALQFQPAQKLFEKILTDDPQSVEARVWLGRLALMRNQKIDGEQFLDQALKIQPANAEALALKGVSKMQQKDWSGAIDLFNQARNSDPKLQMIYSNLAHCDRKLGKLNEAEANARKAIELNETDFQAHSELSNILGRTGRIEQAIEEMNRALKINPMFLKGYLVLGTYYKSTGKHDAAIEIYHRALRHIPTALPIVQELADLYAVKRDYQSASRNAVVLAAARNDFRDYLRMGAYALGMQDQATAGKAFRHARTLNYEPVVAGEYLKKIAGTDNDLYRQADQLRKTIEAEG